MKKYLFRFLVFIAVFSALAAGSAETGFCERSLSLIETIEKELENDKGFTSQDRKIWLAEFKRQFKVSALSLRNT